MTGSCEGVVFSFGMAALLSYIFTASHTIQILNNHSRGRRCCHSLVPVAFPEIITFTSLPETTMREMGRLLQVELLY